MWRERVRAERSAAALAVVRHGARGVQRRARQWRGVVPPGVGVASGAGLKAGRVQSAAAGAACGAALRAGKAAQCKRAFSLASLHTASPSQACTNSPATARERRCQ